MPIVGASDELPTIYDESESEEHEILTLAEEAKR